MSSVEEVYAQVFALFDWESDRRTRGVFEYWDTFEDRVRARLMTKADCEDFTMTVLTIGIEDCGWDPAKCRVARVLTDRRASAIRKPFDHAIGFYDGLVIDNIQGRPVEVGELNYKFFDFADIPITNWEMYQQGQGFLAKGSW